MVEMGNTAVIHYTARMVDGDDAGKVVDTTDVDVALETGVYHGHRNYEPMSFTVGETDIIPGLDATVQEMERGEERTVILDPEDTFGEYDPEKVIEYPREKIESRSNTEAEVGELVTTDTDESGWIVDVDDETVTIDFNHELAGEQLEFEIKLLDVK